MFTGASREGFAVELAVERRPGRAAPALRQAVVALPYYWGTGPGVVRQATHALHELLLEGI